MDKQKVIEIIEREKEIVRGMSADEKKITVILILLGMFGAWVAFVIISAIF